MHVAIAHLLLLCGLIHGAALPHDTSSSVEQTTYMKRLPVEGVNLPPSTLARLVDQDIDLRKRDAAGQFKTNIDTTPVTGRNIVRLKREINQDTEGVFDIEKQKRSSSGSTSSGSGSTSSKGSSSDSSSSKGSSSGSSSSSKGSSSTTGKTSGGGSSAACEVKIPPVLSLITVSLVLAAFM